LADKAVPVPTPESQRYWDGTDVGELWIPRCTTTGRFFFPPRRFSPFVAGGAVEWVRATGRATLYSYVINHRPAAGFEGDGPYAIAVVELEEGLRMMTNIVGVEATPERLVLDMALTVSFQPRGERMVPVFEPAVVSESPR
jgi:uncharacterized protein